MTETKGPVGSHVALFLSVLWNVLCWMVITENMCSRRGIRQMSSRESNNLCSDVSWITNVDSVLAHATSSCNFSRMSTATTQQVCSSAVTACKQDLATHLLHVRNTAAVAAHPHAGLQTFRFDIANAFWDCERLSNCLWMKWLDMHTGNLPMQ